MQEDNGHYVQYDPRWKGIRWYYPALSRTLGALTDRLHEWERRDGKGAKAVHTALARFCGAVRQTLASPPKPQPGSVASLNQGGCHLVSLCNVLRHFQVRLSGRVTTPPVFLRSLQDAGLLTLTFCSLNTGFDPMSLLTRGSVLLSQFEDFGRGGAPPAKSRILCQLKRGQVAVANVESHEHFGQGASGYTHYVLLTRRVRGPDWAMQDPAMEGEARMLTYYRRVYAVWAYRQGNKDSRKRGGR